MKYHAKKDISPKIFDLTFISKCEEQFGYSNDRPGWLVPLNIGKIECHDMQSTTSLRPEMRGTGYFGHSDTILDIERKWASLVWVSDNFVGDYVIMLSIT